jgi:hypothetical protein
MRGYLKDHVGVFDPDDVVILLAAFDKAWEAVRASGVRYPADKVESVQAILAKHIIAAAMNGERDLGRLRDALFSPWLNQICGAGLLAERRSSLCREPDRRCACYLVGAGREAENVGSDPCAISPPQLTGSTTGFVGMSFLIPLKAG